MRRTFENPPFRLDRRSFLGSALAGGVALGLAEAFPAWAQSGSHGVAAMGISSLRGDEI